MAVVKCLSHLTKALVKSVCFPYKMGRDAEQTRIPEDGIRSGALCPCSGRGFKSTRDYAVTLFFLLKWAKISTR